MKTMFNHTMYQLICVGIMACSQEIFTNSHEYKNVNIANFFVTVPLKRNWMNEVCNLDM